MGRWRAPTKPSSPYITRAGAERLRAELTGLWELRRREVVPAVTAAAAEGDRSENAEYIYRKKQLGEIDRRIRYLDRRLEAVQIIDQLPRNQDEVRFGAWVTLTDAQGQSQRYRIVGADEIDPERGWISIDSPVARELLGKATGITVKVQLPDRVARLTIEKIDYRSEPTAD